LNLSEGYRKYRYDEIIFYEKEVLPFKERLNKKDEALMEAKWDYVSKAYFEQFVLPNMTGIEKFNYAMSHLPQYLKGMLHRIKEKAVGWIEDNYLNRNMMIVCLWSLIAYALLVYRVVPLPFANETTILIIKIFLGLSILNGCFAIFLRVMRIVRHLWLTLKYIVIGR